jgi:hypothetical protein
MADPKAEQIILKPLITARETSTTSGMLLRKAAERFGMDEIARTLDVPAAALADFLDRERSMTLSQQRMLALAVLLLCDGHDDLRRHATALLSQVRAVTEYESGITVRHIEPPPHMGWF